MSSPYYIQINMNFLIILLMFSLVGYIQVSGQNTDGTSSSETDQSGLYLATYGVYLIGFTMLIMFLIIIYLGYTLIKVKGHQYKIMNETSLPAFVHVEKSNQNTYNRQESMEVPILTNSTIVTPVDEDVIIEEHFFENANSSLHLVNNEASTPNFNMRHKSKILPMIKKSANSQFILPEDKMKEICIGVLKNRKSIKDLNEFVGLIENRSNENKSTLAREKSASTPILDLIYDIHQTKGSENNQNFTNNQNTTNNQDFINNQDSTKNQESANNQDSINDQDSTKDQKSARNQNFTNSQDSIKNQDFKNNFTDKEQEKTISEIPFENIHQNGYNVHTDEIYDCPPLPKEIPELYNDCDGDTEEEDEIYDCPPVPKEVDKNGDAIGSEEIDEIYDSPPVVSNTKKIIVEDTEYLIVIDPAIDEYKKEPSYINANENSYN